MCEAPSKIVDSFVYQIINEGTQQGVEMRTTFQKILEMRTVKLTLSEYLWPCLYKNKSIQVSKFSQGPSPNNSSIDFVLVSGVYSNDVKFSTELGNSQVFFYQDEWEPQEKPIHSLMRTCTLMA